MGSVQFVYTQLPVPSNRMDLRGRQTLDKADRTYCCFFLPRFPEIVKLPGSLTTSSSANPPRVSFGLKVPLWNRPSMTSRLPQEALWSLAWGGLNGVPRSNPAPPKGTNACHKVDTNPCEYSLGFSMVVVKNWTAYHLDGSPGHKTDARQGDLSKLVLCSINQQFSRIVGPPRHYRLSIFI